MGTVKLVNLSLLPHLKKLIYQKDGSTLSDIPDYVCPLDLLMEISNNKNVVTENLYYGKLKEPKNLTESCTILETVYLDIEEIIAGKLDGLLNRSITENILPSETFTEKLIVLTTTEKLKLIMPTVPISVVIKMKINGSH